LTDGEIRIKNDTKKMESFCPALFRPAKSGVEADCCTTKKMDDTLAACPIE
jgi:hypothetical protein